MEPSSVFFFFSSLLTTAVCKPGKKASPAESVGTLGRYPLTCGSWLWREYVSGHQDVATSQAAFIEFTYLLNGVSANMCQ